MPDEKETQKKVDYLYHVDQEASANAYFDTELSGETVRIQVTARYGSSSEKIVKTVGALIDAYAVLRELYPRAIPAPAEPTRVPLDENGNEAPQVKVATAGRLSIEMKDGKTWYKVMDAVFAPNEKGTKYGITVWPEVLKAASLDVSNPAALPNISGWHVDYVCNDKGYPQKVTRLLPPK